MSGAEAYNIQLLRDGSDYGNVIVVNGGSTTTSDLAPHMNDDGVYTFRVQAAAAGTQSEWSDASATSYKRDTQKPTIKGEPSKRIDAKTAEFYFTSSEEGTYYYMVGSVNGGVPTAEQIADDTAAAPTSAPPSPSKISPIRTPARSMSLCAIRAAI